MLCLNLKEHHQLNCFNFKFFIGQVVLKICGVKFFLYFFSLLTESISLGHWLLFQAINEKVTSHRNRTKDVLAAVRRLSHSSAMSGDLTMTDKMDDLVEKTANMARQATISVSSLEQMLALATKFWQTRENLLEFFEQLEKEIQVETLPCTTPKDIKLELDKIKVRNFIS